MLDRGKVKNVGGYWVFNKRGFYPVRLGETWAMTKQEARKRAKNSLVPLS